ncbi:MAG: molybdopterin molybdotransferase MoeA [Gammaproteobacteria bacterium]|nr:molybdopterin molybdotransferase MoeA [Gammaproteobacteria bacterium]
MNTTIAGKQSCDNASNLLTVNEAKEKILDAIKPIERHEQVDIRSSLNRVLGEDIQSSINIPPYDNSAMDGYAVASSDLPDSGSCKLQLVGESFAGRPFEGEVKQGKCIRIMTGAMIPKGTNTVIMQEHVEREGKTITIPSGYKPGQNKRCAGEDMHIGQTVLTTGTVIGAAELGILASLGIAEIKVFRPIKVAFFSTGDELKDAGESLEEGQIYDSNRYTLYGMLHQMGVELLDLGIINDNREDIRKTFLSLTETESVDAIITTGGVSVGEADFIKDVLEEIGEINFWRVAIKPGKPLAIGSINNAFFFGLPGNPVSSMVTFYQFVQPALRRLAGESKTDNISFKVRCANELRKKPGRLEYQRGILQYDQDGNMVVSSSGAQGSHILTSMSNANCLIILPAECDGVKAGEYVEVQPFHGLI